MPQHIVLLDHTLSGHHFSFCCSFSKILLQQGHRVSCILPGGEEVRKWVERELPGKANNLNLFDYAYQPVQYKRRSRFNDTRTVLHRWKAEAKMMRVIERQTKQKIDLVFFAWLDNNITSYIPGWLLNLYFPWKWSGLYFHPYHLRQTDIFLKRKAVWRDHDSVLLAGNCKAVAVHDIGIVNDFIRRIGKPVIHFPETADDTPPDFNNGLYTAIKDRAKGRIVTGMIGCESHKGTLTLVRAAKKADPSQFFFAFLGILPKETYGEADWKEVQEYFGENRENCFTRFQHLREGAEYNAVFSAFDIPYLVYDNFISSSNRLTKAAILERLVLAQDNYCVGDDVKRFNLGETVTPRNSEKVLEGLEKLAARIKSENYPLDQWKAYRELNSNEKLYQRFEELLRYD